MNKTVILALSFTIIALSVFQSHTAFASPYAINGTNSTLVSFPIIHMNDTTTSSGISTFVGRQIQAEYVSPISQLVGDKIDSITLQLRKTGLPSGTAEIGVFNTDLSVKKLFGTISPSTLTGVYSDFTFTLPSDVYTIESGDRIGIKYAGGNSTNFVAVMRDTNPADPFDGTNSYHTYYDTTWKTFTTNDLYMILKQTKSDSNGSIGLADLAPNSVDSSKIVDGSIVNLDISPSAAILLTKLAVGLLPPGIMINSANIVDNSVTNSKIADDAITNTKISNGSINSTQIQNGAISLADLAPNSVNSSKILDGSVTREDLANNSGIVIGAQSCPSGKSMIGIDSTGHIVCQTITYTPKVEDITVIQNMPLSTYPPFTYHNFSFFCPNNGVIYKDLHDVTVRGITLADVGGSPTGYTDTGRHGFIANVANNGQQSGDASFQVYYTCISIEQP